MVNVERRQQEETRYRLLETVRQYAREKLEEVRESHTFHDRHLGYYLNLSEAIEPKLRTSATLDWLQVLNREISNLRIALSWALDGNGGPKIESGLRLACALLNFWHTQNFHVEGYTWLSKGLSVLSAEDPAVFKTRARACFSAGHLIVPLGRLEEAQQWLQESLEIYRKIGEDAGRVMAQSMLGEIYAWRGSFEEAKALGEASLAISRTLDDAWLLAWVLCRLGTSFFYRNEYALALPILEESLVIFEQEGDKLQVGAHLTMLGGMAFIRGDLTELVRIFQ